MEYTIERIVMTVEAKVAELQMMYEGYCTPNESEALALLDEIQLLLNDIVVQCMEAE